MSFAVQAVFFGLACVAFVLVTIKYELPRISFLGLGLLLAFFVFFWNALALS